jgi:hypothetical protein
MTARTWAYAARVLIAVLAAIVAFETAGGWALGVIVVRLGGALNTTMGLAVLSVPNLLIGLLAGLWLGPLRSWPILLFGAAIYSLWLLGAPLLAVHRPESSQAHSLLQGYLAALPSIGPVRYSGVVGAAAGVAWRTARSHSV